MYAPLLALLGLLGGVGASTFLPTRSVVDVTLLIRPLPGNAFSTRVGDTLVDLKTEAQLPTSDGVLERAAPPGSDKAPIESLRRRLGVRLIDNAEVIVISVRGDTPAQAHSFAGDVAGATLAVRTARAAAAFADRAEVLKPEIAVAEDDLRRATAPGGVVDDVGVLSQRLVTLRSELRSATGATPRAGSVIGTSAATQPGRHRLALAFPATGTVAGAGLGLLLARRHGRRRRARHAAARSRRLPAGRAPR